MSLTLHFHPLSSFCMKSLIALYENGTPFIPHVVDLGDPASRDAFLKLWPVGKFPVLTDDARNETIPESTPVIEYLALYHPGKTTLLPSDPETNRRARLLDRHCDLNIHIHMQKVVTDRRRPEGKNDPVGVEDARRHIRNGCGVLEKEIGARAWLAGDDFTLADCAAAPALFYVDLAVMPLADEFPKAAAYLDRLKARPSFARVLKEAEPFMQWVPR